VLRRSFLASASALFARTTPEEMAVAFRHLTKTHGVTHAVLHMRTGNTTTELAAGAAQPNTVFLLASITKPMTATAVMQLAERGELKLADPVRKYIPELQNSAITIRHLLTHTSGLPDMLPENDALRQRHAPLPEWVALTCKTPLLFAPGSECRYQSMGILLAAEIVQRLTKQPLPTFLAKQLFAPLGMNATTLGLSTRALKDTAPSQVTGNDSWNWNSPYWRNLGAPWGGALAPAADVAKFLAAFLHPGQQKILPPNTAQAMVTDQNIGLNKPWGLGWAVKTGFGKNCSSQTFGHGGSTGTLCWADPAQHKLFVLLTTKPAAESNKPVLHPLSNLASL
jgi:CubicO group peptidase (beta-lactamase class C family)